MENKKIWKTILLTIILWLIINILYSRTEASNPDAGIYTLNFCRQILAVTSLLICVIFSGWATGVTDEEEEN